MIGSAAGGGVIDARLGPLADNGGVTRTHALLPGSPAINAGDLSAITGQDGVSEFDQRGAGFGRVSGARMDMGAIELQQAGCDFGADLACDMGDLDLLYFQLGGSDESYDLHGSGIVDNDDVTEWLLLASADHPFGRAFL